MCVCFNDANAYNSIVGVCGMRAEPPLSRLVRLDTWFVSAKSFSMTPAA